MTTKRLVAPRPVIQRPSSASPRVATAKTAAKIAVKRTARAGKLLAVVKAPVVPTKTPVKTASKPAAAPATTATETAVAPASTTAKAS